MAIPRSPDYEIRPGDIVRVNFNNAQVTLSGEAYVKHQPQATGDSWIFEDCKTGEVHYVSEGCTVTRLHPFETLHG